MSATPYTGGKQFVARAGGLSSTKGYDIVATRLRGERREEAVAKANAVLHDGDFFVPFYCLRTNLDLNLAGTTAQSRFVRDFYAHNIEIPSIRIFGECLDQQDYSNLTEFIRQAQRKGIEQNRLTQISITDGGSDINPNNHPKIKGHHKPILAHGYVKNMPRHHERHVYAPVFSFEFVIAEMLNGIYQEATREEPAQKTWLQILQALTEKPPAPQVSSAEVHQITKKVVDIGADLEGLLKIF